MVIFGLFSGQNMFYRKLVGPILLKQVYLATYFSPRGLDYYVDNEKIPQIYTPTSSLPCPLLMPISEESRWAKICQKIQFSQLFSIKKVFQ